MLETKAELYRTAQRAAAIGALVNLGLGAAKLGGGLAADSYALVSDAVNSLGDAGTSIVVFLALRVAARPPDHRHPYGHTRAEAVAASNVAVVLILSALWVGLGALRRLSVLHDAPPAWTLWIAGANAVIKECLYRYKAGVGRRTGSAALIANAWDHRADAFCALAVLVGLAIVRWGGPRLVFADEVAALVVVGAILAAGGTLLYRSVHELLDVQADEDLLARIRAVALSVEGVLGVEKLFVRKTGLEYLADIHVEVDPELTVARGHAIGHRVKDELLAAFPRLRDVLVHLEPHRR